MDEPESGWTRYLVKAKFGLGRDFIVLDQTETQVFYVDGKAGLPAKADVQDAEGNTVVSVRGALMPIPKRATITDAEGEHVGELKAKAFSPVKARMTLTMTDGTAWQLEGELLEKNYTVTADGAALIVISQKWMKVRDSYTLDVADGTSAALALALLWTLDRWVEQD